MYFENCDTVFPMKKQMIVVRKNEIGIVGPALRAMIGNVKTTLIDGAMCVMPWNTTWGRSRTLRRSRGVPVLLAVSAVTGNLPRWGPTWFRSFAQSVSQILRMG